MGSVEFIVDTLLVDEMAVDGYAGGGVIVTTIEGDGFGDVSDTSASYAAATYNAESGGGSSNASNTDTLSSQAPTTVLFVLPEAATAKSDVSARLIISAIDIDAGDAYAPPHASAEPPPAGEASPDAQSNAQAPAPVGAMSADMNIGAGLVIGDDGFYWKPIEDDGQIISPGDVDGDGFETGGDDGSGSFGDDDGTVNDYSGYGYSSYGTSAGDVNGDGFDDSIVTTYACADGVYTSSTFVAFGSAEGPPAVADSSAIDGSNGFVITGASADGYGPSLAAAGDINGDGFADLIVNSYGWNGSQSAYVVFGNADGAASVDVASLDGTNGFKVDGLDVGDYGSWWVSAVGDVNGDGFDDIVIDAFQWSSDDSYSQASYILLGTGDGFAAALDATTLASAGDYLREPEPDDSAEGVIGIGIISEPSSDDDVVNTGPVICDIMPILVAWGEPEALL